MAPANLIEVGINRTVDTVLRAVYGESRVVLNVCLDDCGNFADSEYVSFCGFFTDTDSWSGFQREWRTGILKPHQVPTIHMADLMNFRGHYKRDNGWNEARRVEVLEHCAFVINKWIIGAVAIVVDVKAYIALSREAKKRIGKTDELCFTRCLTLLVNQLREEGYDYPFAIIVDDCEQFSMRCYGMLRDIKRKSAEWRKRVGGIMFVEDELYSPIQAADLFSYLITRRKSAEYRGGYEPLIDKIMSGKVIGYELYDAKELTRLDEFRQKGGKEKALQIIPTGEPLS